MTDVVLKQFEELYPKYKEESIFKDFNISLSNRISIYVSKEGLGYGAGGATSSGGGGGSFGGGTR